VTKRALQAANYVNHTLTLTLWLARLVLINIFSSLGLGMSRRETRGVQFSTAAEHEASF